MCRVLRVSKSGYYKWRSAAAGGKPPPPRSRRRRRDELTARIRQVFESRRGVYGSPRVFRELKAAGESCCENTVAKLMRISGLRSVARRRFKVRTTDSNHGHPVAPNVLDRHFEQPAPDKAWAADITFVPTQQGWLYLAVVLDLCSRRVVGWAADDHMRSELCATALDSAVAARRPGPGLIHHSDRGVQYACDDYQILLKKNAMTCSMSRTGDCYDNAPVESFFASLKTECVHRHAYATREQARQSLFEYIEVFHNRQRLHSSLGYKTPERFEAELIQ
jgi:transposase InsO family protein